MRIISATCVSVISVIGGSINWICNISLSKWTYFFSFTTVAQVVSITVINKPKGNTMTTRTQAESLVFQIGQEKIYRSLFTHIYIHSHFLILLFFSCRHTRCQSWACLHRQTRTHAPTFTDTHVHQHLLLLRLPNSCCQRWAISPATRYFKQSYRKNICCSLPERTKLWIISACGCAAGWMPGSARITTQSPTPPEKEIPVLWSWKLRFDFSPLQ